VGFWSWFAGVTANDTIGDPPTVGAGATGASNPGDPDGVVFEGFEPTFTEERAAISPLPWDGYPAEWAPPSWDQGRFNDLVDTAWTCLDLNASVLSTMPVYRTRNQRVLPPTSWMTNPDPAIYTSWHEFAKQLFWDYQLGEAFVLPMAMGADGFPMNFRVIPPWLVNVEMGMGRREYRIGTMDVTNDILHIRYKSTTDGARGVGPLESGRNRLIAAGVLERYATEMVRGGGIPYYAIEVERRLSKDEADDLLAQWWESRKRNLGKPAVLSGGAKAKQLQINPQDIGLLDLAKFNESMIARDLGVPAFLVNLPSGGDSMTYSNVSSLFDFHDRASLKTKAVHVMSALSGWALPRGQSAELNRDEYSRPGLKERAEANAILLEHGVLSVEEWRVMERLTGTQAAEALTGGGE
jgi:HK97 family phage portal protein